MLRAVVRNFLETLGEREFDAPLLALLASQGFYEIHFIHGGFEFGKDVVAKRADDGTVRQYSIQSKAGDLTQGDWRSVRPQLEECDYNTRAHPSFDANLPRVAVLVTTGVLKGAAAVDAQEYKQAHASRGLADFEVWDRETITNWLCLDPALGLTTRQVQDDLVTLLNQVARHQATEPMMEKHTRAWIEPEPTTASVGRASIEAAVIAHGLRNARRLDLTAYLALQLYRSSWTPAPAGPSATSAAALRLFTATAEELLTQAEPFLDDPLVLANQVKDTAALFTYPAACVRLAEILSLLAITEVHGALHDRAVTAVRALATTHPGTARPPSDQFAAGILPIATVLTKVDPIEARTYLRGVSQWLLDTHDTQKNGLGLGSIDESERVQFERIVAGTTTLTELKVRRSSYMAGVVLDALAIAGAGDLYDAVRANLDASRVVAQANLASEPYARWRRGGPNVHVQPRVEYPLFIDRPAHRLPDSVAALDAVLLTAVTRTRHYTGAYQQLLG